MISRRWSLSTSFMLPTLRVLHVDRSGTPAGRHLSRKSIPALECRDASGRRQADLWGIGPEVELLGRLVLGDTPARIRRRTPTSGDKLTQFRHYVERAVAADDSLLGPGATRRLIENHAATDRPWSSVRMSRPDRRARSALQDDTRGPASPDTLGAEEGRGRWGLGGGGRLCGAGGCRTGGHDGSWSVRA
jgi:hypothetical protein